MSTPDWGNVFIGTVRKTCGLRTLGVYTIGLQRRYLGLHTMGRSSGHYFRRVTRVITRHSFITTGLLYF